MWTLAVKVFTLRQADQLDSPVRRRRTSQLVEHETSVKYWRKVSGALVSTISRSVKRSSSQNLEVDVSLSYARALVATFSRAGPGSLRVKYVGVYVR